MRVRIIQWNISTRCNAISICKYLSEQLTDSTVINLQEVTQIKFEEIISILKPTSSAYSMDLRSPGKNEGKNRRMGVVTISFGLTINSFDLLHRTVFPERTLYSNLQINDKKISILNFHSLTGVGYKKAKASNFATIADFLDENSIDFACFDANEPETDAMNYQKVECWDNEDKGYYASLIIGKNKSHKLSDSYISYLNNQRIIIKNNPIAVSHISGGTPRRYDYILNSPDWKPSKVSYPYQESIDASSDHSAVIGDFIWQ